MNVRKLEVDVEIHAPGIDLHSNRRMLHELFMDEVGGHFIRAASMAWRGYQEFGRGAIIMTNGQGLRFFQRRLEEEGEDFPGLYLSRDTTMKRLEGQLAASSIQQLLEQYEPEEQVPFLVRHHADAMMSCYLFSCDPTPPACYKVLTDNS